MAAQPFNIEYRHKAPREVDASLDEFWLPNPFDFERLQGFNLSMFERNRLFLNTNGRSFVDASHVSGVDLESDSRAVAVGDFNEDDRPDMIVRSAGGGALRVFLNQIPGGRALKVLLRGTRSNANGIGARLVLDTGERRLHRDHFPQNSLMTQNANETIFGLGASEGPYKLTITWPSGAVQVLERVKPGALYVREPSE